MHLAMTGVFFSLGLCKHLVATKFFFPIHQILGNLVANWCFVLLVDMNFTLQPQGACFSSFLNFKAPSGH